MAQPSNFRVQMARSLSHELESLNHDLSQPGRLRLELSRSPVPDPTDGAGGAQLGSRERRCGGHRPGAGPDPGTTNLKPVLRMAFRGRALYQ